MLNVIHFHKKGTNNYRKVCILIMGVEKNFLWPIVFYIVFYMDQFLKIHLKLRVLGITFWNIYL